MRPRESNFSVLINELRGNGDQAATRVVEEFADLLVNLARERLQGRLARRVDPEDIVQSAFRSFFHRARRGDFEIADRNSLAKLLVTIVLNKVRRQADFHCAARRDVRRESIAASTVGHGLRSVRSPAPDPQTEVMVSESMSAFFRSLPENERAVVHLRLEGRSTDDIAAATGRAPRSVRRILERARTQLESRLEAG
jgi:RNA polymerase sigma-70 factor (ECF subfamily)